jgi:hypothetical protein
MKFKPPSVTQVLRETGAAVLYPDYASIPDQTLDLKRRLGTSVHRLCAMAATKRAGLKLPDNPSADYARQFVKWLEKTGAKVLRSEFEVIGYRRNMKYIGHPDLEVSWNNQRWLLDIKTRTAALPVHGIQLAAYAVAMKDWDFLGPVRGVLWLSPSSAKLVPFTDERDFDAWEACLTLWYWRRNHGK